MSRIEAVLTWVAVAAGLYLLASEFHVYLDACFAPVLKALS